MAWELRTTAGRMELDPWRVMGDSVGNKKDEQRPTARWWVGVWCGLRCRWRGLWTRGRRRREEEDEVWGFCDALPVTHTTGNGS